MEQKILPSQGETKYLEALEIAIEREIKAKFMYETIAKYVTNAHMKTKMAFLAEEEQNHRDNLEDLYKKMAGKKKSFDDLVKFPEATESAKKYAELKVVDLLVLAAEKEQEAHDFYIELAGSSTEDGLKDLFNYLAEEESNHKRILELEVKLYTGQKPMGAERSVEMVPGIYKEWW